MYIDELESYCCCQQRPVAAVFAAVAHLPQFAVWRSRYYAKFMIFLFEKKNNNNQNIECIILFISLISGTCLSCSHHTQD